MATYHGMTELDRLRGFFQDEKTFAELDVNLDIPVDQSIDVEPGGIGGGGAEAELKTEGGRRKNPPWHADVDIQPDPGWYFFRTNAPYTVFGY